jgi:cytochrome c biogenesis protein CcmG/thiol:disulfide interchange protein DsbE
MLGMTARRTVPLASLAASIAITVVVLSACGGGASDPTTATDVVAEPALVVSPVPGLPATVDELPEIDVAGYDALLGELRGTPVVVNFWASWCGPCQAEAPRFAAAAAEYGDRVQFLGVDILDDRTSAAGFIAEHGLPYPNVFDPGGAIRTDLGSIGQPVTAFYDADGNLIAKVDGEISEKDLAANLEAITA